MSSRATADHHHLANSSTNTGIPPTTNETSNQIEWNPSFSFASPQPLNHPTQFSELATPPPVASPLVRSSQWNTPVRHQDPRYYDHASTDAQYQSPMQPMAIPNVQTARYPMALEIRKRKSRAGRDADEGRSVRGPGLGLGFSGVKDDDGRRESEEMEVDVHDLKAERQNLGWFDFLQDTRPFILEDLESGRRGSGETMVIGNGEGEVLKRREGYWWGTVDGNAVSASMEDPRALARKKRRERRKQERGNVDVYDLSVGAHNKAFDEHRTIHIHVTTVHSRQRFLIKLAKSLMMFGAPSHRIENQLREMSRTLELNVECIHLPAVFLMSFTDEQSKTTETFLMRQPTALALGNLHEVHQIYRKVLHDEIGAREGIRRLDELMDGKPAYKKWARCFFAFWLSALICPLAFGGSFIDMWIAGIGSLILCALQLTVVQKSQVYANVFEITMTILISFVARGLSSIHSDIFCYDAIASAGIVAILPGFLILSSSLELASKNILCGSVKMVYALTYTLFLGFGLQIGSDFYLLFDPKARSRLDDLAAVVDDTKSYSGRFTTTNSTIWNSTQPLIGEFEIMNATWVPSEHVVDGCLRSPDFSWYLQPFPWWTQLFIVPLFALLSSLANLQPVDAELLAMVFIACVAWTANKLTTVYIHDRADIVSAIGAFSVGILGTIYGRAKRGTAFTAMITGVLFLVPSGLSQGGMMTNGNGIDIGGAMIAVTTGITVGLYMSQTLVYLFGAKRASQWGF